MGVTVWKRSESIKQVLKEHLNNTEVYQNITHEKDDIIDDLQNEFKIFLRTHGRNLPDTFVEFFKRSQDTHGWAKVAQFRATAKVHKNPVKLCPVVAKCNTTIECLSKWLDVKFQKLAGLVPWCVEDSESFRTEVKKIHLSPNARLVTFDAISMYSNMNLDHAMPIMCQWFESYVPAPGEPALAPVDTIMAALELVMRWNIFAFGDSYYRQLIRTAMGTSCAVWFANLVSMKVPSFSPDLRIFLQESYSMQDSSMVSSLSGLENVTCSGRLWYSCSMTSVFSNGNAPSPAPQWTSLILR